MTNQHTSAPWFLYKPSDNEASYSIAAHDGTNDELASNINNIEHAHLIASAPELLEALELINVDKDGDGFICREVMPDIQRVINKAKGV